jgi:hypothetical protein
VGNPLAVTIEIDWDRAEADPFLANELIEEIKGRYYINEEPKGEILAALNRLKAIAAVDDEFLDGIDDEILVTADQ